MYNPELLSKIAEWRAKCADGTMTTEDYREALAALRAGRLSAASSSKKTTKKKEKEILSGDDMLKELGL